MFQNKSVWVRILFMIALCYMVLEESGPFTAIGFVFIGIGMELISTLLPREVKKPRSKAVDAIAPATRITMAV